MTSQSAASALLAMPPDLPGASAVTAAEAAAAPAAIEGEAPAVTDKRGGNFMLSFQTPTQSDMAITCVTMSLSRAEALACTPARLASWQTETSSTLTVIWCGSISSDTMSSAPGFRRWMLTLLPFGCSAITRGESSQGLPPQFMHSHINNPVTGSCTSYTLHWRPS